MKATIKSVAILIAVILSCCAFAACGNDDDKDEPQSPPQGGDNPEEVSIVGMWRSDWGNDPRRDFTAYYFAEADSYNGTLRCTCWDKGNGYKLMTYSYNESEGTITLKDRYDVTDEVLKISHLTPSSITIDSEKYMRSELTNDILILGEWGLHVRESEDHKSFTRVVFRYDGTYEAIDDVDISYGSSESSYTFSSSEFDDRRKSGAYSFTNNNTLIITGNSKIRGRYIIEGLVLDGIRLIREEEPTARPYLYGGWHNR